jgi:hypothetical protein
MTEWLPALGSLAAVPNRCARWETSSPDRATPARRKLGGAPSPARWNEFST